MWHIINNQSVKYFRSEPDLINSFDFASVVYLLCIGYWHLEIMKINDFCFVSGANWSTTVQRNNILNVWQMDGWSWWICLCSGIGIHMNDRWKQYAYKISKPHIYRCLSTPTFMLRSQFIHGLLIFFSVVFVQCSSIHTCISYMAVILKGISLAICYMQNSIKYSNF